MWTLRLTLPASIAPTLRAFIKAHLHTDAETLPVPPDLVQLVVNMPQQPPPDLSDRVEGWLANLGATEAQLSTQNPTDPAPKPGWEAFFQGALVSPSIAVRPPWSTVSLKAHQTLILDPRGAFGSGFHVTSRLLLALLDKKLSEHTPTWNLRDHHVLDVGCGSGILSILAAKLGAQVMALDRSPRALTLARENAQANGVEANITFSLDPLDQQKDSFDLVMANLGQVLELTPILASLCHGDLFLSCLHTGQREKALKAANPLHLHQEVEEDGWLSLWLRP